MKTVKTGSYVSFHCCGWIRRSIKNAAKELFRQWAEPINRVILWAVPFIALGALGYTWIKWSAKDEDEKEQKPFMKSAKKIIFTAIFVELGSAIFRIFGLNTN